MPQSPRDPPTVTEALRALREGGPGEVEPLVPALYAELRQIAARQMAGERAGHTLQPTALLHEAWIKLAAGAPAGYQDRTHFFAVAARAMRQVLVDHARRRAAGKRGGDPQRVTLTGDIADDEAHDPHELLELHDALEKLGAHDPALGQMVELRFFGGLTLDETADTMGLSRRKVAKDWAFARGWLRRALGGDA